MNVKIGLDMDGVLFDFEASAFDMMGVSREDREKCENHLVDGGKIEDFYPEMPNVVWGNAESFFENLNLFPWANDLYNLVNQNADDHFILTSAGNYRSKNPEHVANAVSGKYKALLKYFPGVDVVITREKYHCASSDTILIDDYKGKINGFRKNGGIGLHWPNQYKLLRGIVSIDDVLGELEEIIYTIKESNSNWRDNLPKDYQDYMLFS